MSRYEDYNTTCNSYDDNRQPLGADVVAGMTQVYSRNELKDIHLLDAGCGTGNYAKALIGYGVGNVTLMDASSGMLDKARVKLADAIADNTVVDTVEHKLPSLPFKDDTFDVIVFSLVLHHLDPGNEKGDAKPFKELEQSITEARRVLRPDGSIIIIASTADDILNSWYYHINKEITRRFVTKFASVRQYLDIFKRTGVHCVQMMRFLGSVLTDYLNPEGPFDKAWRDSDSYWAVATEKELNDAKQKLRVLKQNGELEEWVHEHDRITTQGIATMFVCKLTDTVVGTL